MYRPRIGNVLLGAGYVAQRKVRKQLAPLGRLVSGGEVVKSATGRKMSDLAQEIRHLGRRFERTEEAQTVARQLEKTADYIRFRSAGGMGHDLLKVMRKKSVLLTAGGVAGGYVAYRLLTNHRH